MNFLSLFSGIGGFDLGLERAGMECVGQCDNDPFCNKVLAKHWPEVRRFDDVRHVGNQYAGWQRLGSSVSEPNTDSGSGRASPFGIDLICGGFPCQDLSVAGKRAGLDGERSGLWFEFKRILSELRPRWAIIENVPGLLSSNQGRDFAVLLDGLEECGFGGISWAILDSQFFGVPQRRRRVYVIAGPSRRCTEQVLSICESGDWHPQTGRTQGEGLAGTLAAGAHPSGFNGQDAYANHLVANPLPGHHPRHDLDNDTYIPDVAYTLNARDDHGLGQREGVTTRLAHTLRADGFDASEDGTGRGTPVVAVRTAQTGSNGWGVNEDTAYTLDRAEGQAVSQGAAVRRLTPVECERLQGFPDDWTKLDDKTPDGPRYKACGNAVSVPVIEYLGKRIMGIEVTL